MTQADLFGHSDPSARPRGRTRAGWEKIRKEWPGVWRHAASGLIIRHCGHPAALWPYAVYDQAGKALLRIAPNGRAFGRLADCQAAAEEFAGPKPAGGYHLSLPYATGD